jgi:hypothetical protein
MTLPPLQGLGLAFYARPKDGPAIEYSVRREGRHYSIIVINTYCLRWQLCGLHKLIRSCPETSLMTHRSQNDYIVNFSLQCDDRSCAIQGTHSLTQKSVTLSSGIRMLVNIGKTESLSAHRVLSPTSIINMHPWIHCYVMFMDKE